MNSNKNPSINVLIEMYDAENHPLLLDNLCTRFLLMGPVSQYVFSRKHLKNLSLF